MVPRLREEVQMHSKVGQPGWRGVAKTSSPIALVIALVLLPAGIAHGAHWLFVVGIDQYDDPRIVRLAGAVKDAKSLERTFSALYRVPEENIFLFVSDSKIRGMQPTKGNIIGTLRHIADKAEAGDEFIFFFAGHGVSRGDKSYLLTFRSEMVALADSGLPVPRLMELIGQVKASRKLIILDACRNDPEAGRGQKDNALTEQFARGLSVRGVESAKKESVAMLFSSSLGERAYEIPGEGRGFFAYYVEKGIEGAAADDEGVVSVSSLVSYLRREVALSVKRRVGPDSRQVPHLRFEGADPAAWVLARHVPSQVDEGADMAGYESQLKTLGKGHGGEPDAKYVQECRSAWWKLQSLLPTTSISTRAKLKSLAQLKRKCSRAVSVMQWAKESEDMLARAGRHGTLKVSAPEDSQVYVGVTRLGVGPVEAKLLEGRYRVAVADSWETYRRSEQEVVVEAGKTTRIKLEPPREKVRTDGLSAELADCPEWVLMGCAGGLATVCGVGASSGILNPAFSRLSAYNRAVLDASRQCLTTVSSHYQSAVPAANSDSMESSITKQITQISVVAESMDEWTASTGTRWQVVGSTCPASLKQHEVDGGKRTPGAGEASGSQPRTSSSDVTRTGFVLTAVGVGDVAAHGSTGAALLASARLSAVSVALYLLSTQTDGVHVKALLKDFLESESGTLAQSTTDVSRHNSETEYVTRTGFLGVNAACKDYMAVYCGDSGQDCNEEQLVNCTVKLTGRVNKESFVFETVDGLAALDHPLSPSATLDLVLRTMDAVGIYVLKWTDLPPINGVPVVEVMLAYHRKPTEWLKETFKQ